MSLRPYRNHLQSSADLVTSHEATRAGFVALALEKNRRSTPYVAEARALQEAASRAKTPADLLAIKGIEVGLLRAAGLSDKALVHLSIGKLRERLLTVSVKRFRKRNTPRMFSL
ncbi:AvaI/BsoBI family type II restriction endonuclease [Thermosynechococcus sp. QS41]|nr:AvaI/BsoBI family type II restriction endonuclease [Thermosynechococcus sp. QS41]